MSQFQLFLWLVLGYLAGSILIGLPIAKYSLSLWKKGTYGSFAGATLFLAAHTPYPKYSDEWWTLPENEVEGKREIASVVLKMMLMWPIHVLLVILMAVIFVCVHVFSYLYERAVSLMTKCGICTKI